MTACPSAPDPGEEWLVRSVGAYLPAVFEEVLDLVDAVILTEKVCTWVWLAGASHAHRADKVQGRGRQHPYVH